MRGMRKLILMSVLILVLSGNAIGLDLDHAAEIFGTEELEQALPESARTLVEPLDPQSPASFSDGVTRILEGALTEGEDTLRASVMLCVQIMGIVLLSAALRGFGEEKTGQVMELAAILAIGVCCVDQISGFFAKISTTVDSMTAFSGFLFSVLAATSAATGAVGTSGTLYGVTSALCALMSRGLQMVFLPGVACYMALMLGDHAVGDGGLSMAADTLKQLITTGLKFAVLGLTAYLSITGVVSGSADAAAVRATKLTISTAVPVVGSMLADASETLLVSAGVIRSSVGIFGLLGVLAISVGPFLETGGAYLCLKCTAAAAAVSGEKRLSGFISAMAGAMGLITALTGVCTLLLMLSCVCFIRGGGV